MVGVVGVVEKKFIIIILLKDAHAPLLAGLLCFKLQKLNEASPQTAIQ